jgi:hypothetical protein
MPEDLMKHELDGQTVRDALKSSSYYNGAFDHPRLSKTLLGHAKSCILAKSARGPIFLSRKTGLAI